MKKEYRWNLNLNNKKNSKYKCLNKEKWNLYKNFNKHKICKNKHFPNLSKLLIAAQKILPQ